VTATLTRSATRLEPALAAVLVLGLVLRLVLVPLTHGQDFAVWDKATSATLRGINVYAHHPNYPGGPYAYFPLFLYLELPMQWLAHVTGAPFTVLGKLPILAADLGIALLIHAEVMDRRRDPRLAAAAAALFLLNPLVLYNGAYYGRFDSVGCVLLLLALRQLRRGSSRAAWSYAAAVAAKTFPGFLLAGVLRAARRRRAQFGLALVVVLAVLSAPYLGTLKPYLDDIFLYDTKKTPQGLSWQRLLLDVVDSDEARLISYLLLAVFVMATVWLSAVDLDRYAVVTLVLFVLLSKVVLEQYLIWPLPWIILGIAGTTRAVARSSVAMMIALTSIGMVANESFHPFGRSPWWLDVTLAGACAAYVAVMVRDHARSTQ
jgi:hypothetical protein